MNSLFQKTAIVLTAYLERVLPVMSDNWWEETVLKVLSFQQRQRIKDRKITSLSSLDLAALLRVLDQNWFQLSTKENLTSESRHYVKEMQTIRNRWAHAGSEPFSVDDIYRDLDTLQRFAAMIQADESLLEEIRAEKNALIITAINISGNVSDSKIQKDELLERASQFIPGQVVCLRSDPSIKGAVVAEVAGKVENRYKVFVVDSVQEFYASQLQAAEHYDKATQFIPIEQFHSYLSALQIQYPGISTLYSLNAARVDFIPYQFRPVLRFIRSDRPRLLIADGVGVGKTIEAGLILRELQARRDIRSVLIICPRPLVTERKWEMEMKRFEERFTALDGSMLRYCINEMDLEGAWPEQYQKAIVPYSLLDEVLLYGAGDSNRKKRRKGLLDLDPPPRFDLVIVDEAHHVRNPETLRHQAVRYFCDHAEAVVFLTATPIQLGSNDLFVLLNILRPDLIIDGESFNHMSAPNPFINRAIESVRAQQSGWERQVSSALESAEATPWGRSIFKFNPEFRRIQTMLEGSAISPEERVRLISDLEQMHTLSGIISRTRRRDIGDFAVRKPETVTVPFTDQQKALHDELLAVQAEIFSIIHGSRYLHFMMSTIRRQTASCIYGLAPLIDDILDRHLDEILLFDEDDGDVPLQIDMDGIIESRIQSIRDKARVIDRKDPKLESLSKIIRDKQDLPNNKIMVFSTFIHTLKYLYKHLAGYGFRVGLMYGGTLDEDRLLMRNRFKQPREAQDTIDILLFSEIGCEGLDYQFCDCIVNYDLPWNPMRVEQRIGRIDRNGQKSESVAIYNLITPGTVDADIYNRCLLRIGVFNSALGGGEEILGEITREIKNIAESISLTDEERAEKLQQLADNKIRLIQEQEELEQKQMELFGIRLPLEQMKKEIKQASSYWLSPESLLRLVTVYLKNVCGKDHVGILGDKPLKTMRLSQEARNTLLKDYEQISRMNTPVFREWETWLKGTNPHLPLTFDSKCAMDHPEAAFIMPLHPLVKQAAQSFKHDKRIITAIKVINNEVKPGIYGCAIYQWRYLGIREDLVLKPVASIEYLDHHIATFLEEAVVAEEQEAAGIKESQWDDIEQQHHRLWSEARIEHQRRTKELAQYRKESLATSHNARVSLLEEQLRKTDNEKIKRMRQGQISAAEADYARRIQGIDIAMERADIIATPVAFAVIIIEKGA